MQILEIWLTMVNNLSLFYLIQKYCEYIRYKKKKKEYRMSTFIKITNLHYADINICGTS